MVQPDLKLVNASARKNSACFACWILDFRFISCLCCTWNIDHFRILLSFYFVSCYLQGSWPGTYWKINAVSIKRWLIIIPDSGCQSMLVMCQCLKYGFGVMCVVAVLFLHGVFVHFCYTVVLWSGLSLDFMSWRTYDSHVNFCRILWLWSYFGHKLL